ncbi:iron complex outermembrane receptor protein [Sphingobium sp. OAS761]|uniref:TonB-dependent receptor n=1 Tax=Sphingobium sp. OAS761 TaxID=2817901 RepID=UPI0020A1ED9D|nr:TonB-dependent receptor [Sphingobium sp. OAS761]MCP1471068.1 iron complex outermembrane receptor protein [Sphingobium sp. OAS761]
MSKHSFTRIMTAGFLASVSPMAMPTAWAQQAGAASGVDANADIIVTARREAEAIQRVPISVTAIDDRTLNRGTITGLKDIQYLSPSLSVSTNNTRNTDNLSLRGVGTTFGTDPAVVAYFAEVPLPGGGGGAGNLFDLANVQVLNGPQGTLFGRNTTGGAVLFEPKRPTDQFEARLMVGYGNHDNFEQQAIVNVPLVPGVLAVRAGISHRRRDGYTKDVVTGRDYDNINYTAGRLSILFTPSDAVENLTTLNFMHRNEHGAGGQLHLVNPGFYGTAFDDIVAQQASWGPRRVAYDGAQIDKQKIFLVTNRSRIDLAPNVTLKNIISYATYRNTALIDVDGSTIAGISYIPTGQPGGLQNNGTPAFNQFTEELQLTGKAIDKMLDWTVGAYFQHNRPKANLTLQQLAIFGAPPAYSSQGDDLVSKAVYAQATLDFGAFDPALTGLKATGGIRHTRDRRKDYADRYFDVPGQPCEYLPTSAPNCRYDFAPQVFKATTWTLGLSYQATQSTMVYATARRGFKSGGINLPAPPSDLYSSFAPETVDDIEIGAKTKTMIGTMPFSASVALFRDKFKDIQRALLFPSGSSFALYLVNASTATIKGFEAQFTIEPARGFSLGARHSYLKSKYGTFVDPLSGTSYTGLPLPYTPKHKLTLIAGYNGDLGEAGQLDLNATYAYQSSFRNLDALDPDIVIKGYGLLSLSAGINNIAQSGFDLSLYASNVTNKLYRVGGGNYYYSLGFTTSLYGEPRMVGARLTYHIGG